MNVIGHPEAAWLLTHSEDPAYYFGTIVADLVGAFRLPRLYKKEGQVPSGSLADGIALHGPTNAVFDDLEVIDSLQKNLIKNFQAFIPGLPAHQAGRVGKDILFDACLSDKSDVVDRYQQMMVAAVSGKIALGDITEPESIFRERLLLFTERGVPDYNDPAVIAQILYTRLRGTRVPLDISHTKGIAEVMSNYLPYIHEIGETVMSEVVDGLRTKISLV